MLEERPDFELFKSNVCHRLEESGDIDFIADLLKSRDIDKYYARKWYPESLYLLAMLDYISKENDIPICSDYDDLRKSRLSKTVYPSSVIAISSSSQSNKAKEDAVKSAIPEFLKYNIVESEVRNVV